MKRKGITGILLSVMLTTMLLAGCGKQAGYGGEGHFKDACLNKTYSDEEMLNVKGEKVDISSPELFLIQQYGFGFSIPNSWNEKSDATELLKANYPEDGKCAILISTEAVQAEFDALYDKLDASSEDYDDVYQKMWDTGYALFGICCTDGESGFEKDFSSVEKIGTLEGKNYYFAYNDELPKEGYSEKELQAIQLGIDSLEEVRDSLIIFPETEIDYEAQNKETAEKASGIDLSSFAVTDLNGNAVSQDIFKDYDVTMINVWATWCNPCRRELPDIQAAYEKLPANANIISICDDAGQETELAGQIVEKVGLQYEVLVPDDAMDELLNEYISAFPTTFLVDKEGNVIGQPIIGVPQADDVTQYYLDYIESGLENN